LFARLYLEGLSSGDFEPVFRALLGEEAPLSGSTILRLKSQWADEYRAWNERALTKGRYAYIWCDGLYVGCGQERDKTVLLCVLGARADGTKELLAMAEGYRESTESWTDVFRSLRERGMTPPLLAIGDGGLGAWAALGEVFPQAPSALLEPPSSQYPGQAPQASPWRGAQRAAHHLGCADPGGGGTAPRSLRS
jgi:putative transposase